VPQSQQPGWEQRDLAKGPKKTPRGGEDGRTRPRGGGWVSCRRGDGRGRWGHWLSVATRVNASRFCVRARAAPRLPGVPRWRLAGVCPGEGGSGPLGRGVCRGGRGVQGRARECCCVTAAAPWPGGGGADSAVTADAAPASAAATATATPSLGGGGGAV